MNSQFRVFHGGTFQLVGEAVHLGRLGGELSVLDGRIWLTRTGELGDHFIEAGQSCASGSPKTRSSNRHALGRA